MRPYYEQGAATLYCGDCREILPTLAVRSAIVTDPPYGTGWVRGGGKVGEFVAKHERPEWDVWSTDWLHLCPTAEYWAVFAPLSRLPNLRGALPGSAAVYWRKTNPRPNGPDRDAVVLCPALLPAGIEFAAYNGDTPLHPCQKPTDLMQWVLGFVPKPLVIVDPFAGSGSTLVAAKTLHFQCVGIEMEERYCEIAAKRLEQEVLDLGGVA